MVFCPQNPDELYFVIRIFLSAEYRIFDTEKISLRQPRGYK